MSEKPLSVAEVKSKDAESLPCFGGLNLNHIKRQVAEILRMVGTNGLFYQYTKHDISHIDAMLQLVTHCIIPKDTQELLTPADWLMIVLSVYFHDLGMVVTRTEFDKRNESGFPEFKRRVTSGEQGHNYEQRLSILSDDDKEHFLYEEFVRQHHATRIRAWVTGKASRELGIAEDLAAEVAGLLEPLGSNFRQDLGLIAESHHLEDLDNFTKYLISRPYGMTEESNANLHYAAIVLRTADLLHITSDRTPSIAFRIINPTDPLSQREWAKQMAVTAVRPQVGRDSDGRESETAPKDTLEIFARFTDEEGFFGLTSYLEYAAREIKQSHEWSLMAQTNRNSKYSFPWKNLDQSHIDTEGFLKEKLSFQVDTFRILELLTGHTLYNDAGVVLRELVQNSIDAVRLAYFSQDGALAKAKGAISIFWNSKDRSLIIRDNGTGMNETIIKDHLLRVGSSRYQSQKFLDDHPEFIAISRFGIGVLSAFMISDDVEYTTYFRGDPYVRRMMLRSLHGQYLTRLIEKNDASVSSLMPHGTEVKLRLRHTAKLGDIVTLARYWIVIPGCSVSVTVDENPSISVGYETPGAALQDMLDAGDIKKRENVRIIEKEKNGIQIAFAVSWSEWFKEWSFISVGRHSKRSDLFLGTCVEGIRIDPNTPGFRGKNLYAIANASGKSAPRTNVARSGLESAAREEDANNTIYALYLEHIADERRCLQEERSFSLTWAAGEIKHLLNSLISYEPDVRLNSLSAFEAALSSFPAAIVEKDGQRTVRSVSELNSTSTLWTVHSESIQSIERLLKEIPDSSSLSAVIKGIGTNRMSLPVEDVVVADAAHQSVQEMTFRGREVSEMIVDQEQRRLDLRWEVKIKPGKWIDPEREWPLPNGRVIQILRSLDLDRSGIDNNVYIQRGEVKSSGTDGLTAIETVSGLYLLTSPVQGFFLDASAKIESGATADAYWFAIQAVRNVSVLSFRDDEEIKNFVRSRVLAQLENYGLLDGFSSEMFLIAISGTPWKLFSPNRFNRDRLLSN